MLNPLHPSTHTRRVAFVSLSLVAALLLGPLRAADRRIVAVADVHGGMAGLTAILQQAGLIDAGRQWIGGDAVLVQTGDTTDRGSDVRAVLDFLMELEKQAKKGGGRVEVLLGNHELMNFVGNTRYVTPEILAPWADSRSESRRDRAFADAQRLSTTPLDKTAWMQEHPLGYVEYREAFAPDGKYGRWLRTKPVVVEIDGTVFMHAGIDPVNMLPLDKINDLVRADLRKWDDGVTWLQARRLTRPYSTMAEIIGAAQAVLAHVESKRAQGRQDAEDEVMRRVVTPLAAIAESSLFAGNGPMWYRGFAQWNEEEGKPLAESLLKHYGVKRFVTGHTPQLKGEITARFGGAIYLIDTGLLGGTAFPGGRPSALEIVGDTVTPIYATRHSQLPVSSHQLPVSQRSF